MSKRLRGLAAGVAAFLLAALPVATLAATPASAVGSVTDSRLGGDVRLVMYGKKAGQGAVFTFYSPTCTTTTTDNDWGAADLDYGTGYNWNNKANSWKDISNCDVKFYPGIYWAGTPSAWQNSGGAIIGMSSSWVNNVESFWLS